ncbi:MAG TPA: hypothetical protein VKD22_15060 [Ramlibacter sp.]|nr:hypothetical protein [Ramlibacter sp.]
MLVLGWWNWAVPVLWLGMAALAYLWLDRPRPQGAAGNALVAHWDQAARCLVIEMGSVHDSALRTHVLPQDCFAQMDNAGGLRVLRVPCKRRPDGPTPHLVLDTASKTAKVVLRRAAGAPPRMYRGASSDFCVAVADGQVVSIEIRNTPVRLPQLWVK